MNIKTRGKKTKKLTGLCMKCRTTDPEGAKRRVMLKPVKETMRNGRLAARGTCEVCGGKMFKFLPNE